MPMYIYIYTLDVLYEIGNQELKYLVTKQVNI